MLRSPQMIDVHADAPAEEVVPAAQSLGGFVEEGSPVPTAHAYPAGHCVWVGEVEPGAQ